MTRLTLVFVLFLGLAWETIAVKCSESKVATEGAALKLDQTLRVRRDWADLNNTDRTKFLNALLSIDKNGWLSSFQCYHLSETQKPQSDAIHRTQIFLLWHRTFLWHIETKLMQFGVTLPYWSWEYSAVDPKSAPVFSGDAFGANYGSGCADLSDSVLNGLDLTEDIYDGTGCIARNPTPGRILDPQSSVLYDDTFMSNAVSQSKSFTDFYYAISGPHASYHNYWGDGSFMLGMGSPRDPIFWLYHANIDRHLTNWQLAHPNAWTYPGRETTLSRYNVSPQKILDLKSMNVKYQNPGKSTNRLINVAMGASSILQQNLSSTASSKKRSSNIEHCIDQFSAKFIISPPPSSSTIFMKYLSPAGAPKNTIRLFLDTLDPSFSKLSDSQLAKAALADLKFDPYLDFYVYVASLYEDYDTCSSGGLQDLGARISEPGVLLAGVLNNLKTDDNFRSFVSQFPVTFARSQTTSMDATGLGQLTTGGISLGTAFIGVVGAQPGGSSGSSDSSSDSRKRVDPNLPDAWANGPCPNEYYNAHDGCDCGCGTPDPDCQDQKPEHTFRDEPVPIFGCPNMSSVDCQAGVCVSAGAPPAEWICHLGDYNSTNGCDCSCGVYDPDCRTVFPPFYMSINPVLFGVTGCTNGVNPHCEYDGTCSYGRPVPTAWTCPIYQYGSGDACHCACGTYDPDCGNSSNVENTGCPCAGMTCQNPVGICTGTCGSYSVIISQSSHLSGGAIAGIVIGSIAVAALLIVAVMFVLSPSKSDASYHSMG